MIENSRILVIDDDPGIRNTYRDLLSPSPKTDMLAKGALLFEEPGERPKLIANKQYELTLAEKGEDGIMEVAKAVKQKNPFAVAFIDMKMPGIDGSETSQRIWAIDPDVKIVIVTAYSEFTPDDIVQVTGRDDIFYLRKPFNAEEIRQFARALTKKWNLEHERELLSRKMEDMNRNLKKKVEEQTNLLIQSEKMASMGVLAAGVAHEINNPISFIQGNLSSIKKYSTHVKDLLLKYKKIENYLKNGLSDDVPTLLDELKEFKKARKIDFIIEDIVDLADESLAGTNRISDVVKDLKSFSRFEEAEPKYVDLNNALDTTLNIIWNELKYKTKVVKDYGNLPEVKCYPQKISKVFMNILINAAQAIEEKGTIKIVTQNIKEGLRAEDEKVKITISDTGKGISKNHLVKIFDPFFTTKPVGEGTGLGLSITYEIIRAHGGEITFESEVGSGTNVTIILPLKAKI
ncbi:MAG: response regulator [Desulfobacterales bacterium]|nr:MAG: response regulator [Desulfobacterales bacterium]